MGNSGPSFSILQQQTVDLASFDRVIAEHGCGPLRRGELTTLQINVGKLCNQACHHCHVDAGPKRTEIMSEPAARRVLALLGRSPGVTTVDITGGAPELNANFRQLVTEARESGRAVIDRCNLTVLSEPGMEGLGEFLARHEVQIVASLPCYTADNVDAQRGRGVFDKSIRGLQILNALGYGMPGSGLLLNLVYNPLGATLPPDQARLEADYQRHLRENFGVRFNQLFTLVNMPISRFADGLRRSGKFDSYLETLMDSFSPGTVPQVMCRTLISVGWDGSLYDCDFNQMLEIGVAGARRTIWDLENFECFSGERIATGSHCFGCTAGAGSSCGGALL